MANNKEDSLTLSIGGIPVKGKLITDLDTGVGKWYPISGPTGPFSASLGDKYLTSTKNADGTWSGWTPVGDVFGEIRDQNSQISAAYSTSDKVATEFYKSGSGVGSPTGTLNSGRLNQFNVYGAPQTAKNLGIPGTKSTVGITTTQQSEPTKPTDPSNIPPPEIKYAGEQRKYGNYFYPESIRENSQDFIKFTAYEYVGRSLNKGESTSTSLDPNLGFGDRKILEKIALGSAILPIQPSITDSNTVQWGGEEMNSLGAYAASVSYNAQTDIAGTGEQVLKDIDKIFKSGTTSSVSNAVRLFLAGKAAGVSGLLSRVGGAVLNPNLELLFQGPQLRPFNFTFRLSPRNKEEAQQVKYIIRFFKQNMSVKNSDVNLFLKTPNVFQIKYHLAGDTKGDHPSLNRIKICALQSCSVDYTPDGSYMTFNDAGATMTSYNLTLQFQELEPVTEKDYNDLKDETIIGY